MTPPAPRALHLFIQAANTARCPAGTVDGAGNELSVVLEPPFQRLLLWGSEIIGKQTTAGFDKKRCNEGATLARVEREGVSETDL